MSWDDLVMARAVADAEVWSRPLRLAVARTLRSAAQVADEGSARTPGCPAEKVEDAELPVWRKCSTRSTGACCGWRSPTVYPSPPRRRG